MIEKLFKQAFKELKALSKKRRVIFPEGINPKIQEVALRLKKENIVVPILCFSNNKLIPEIIKKSGIITYSINDSITIKLIQKLFQLRKNKLTIEKAQELMQQTNYFATMLLKEKEADCLVGGIDYTTKDILSPALQIIKTSRHLPLAATANLMIRGKERYIFSDVSLNINPNSEQLSQITKLAIKLAIKLKINNPQVALLSFSTNGSASSESVLKVRHAVEILRQERLSFLIEGEMQFDSALIPEIRKKKMPDSKMKGSADILIFPNLDAANIGYKITEKLAGFKAVGPIVLGLNEVVSDLSRGATIEDIYSTVILTAWRTI